MIAVIMLCVTTPREDTIVPAGKVLSGMEKTVQVKFCLISTHSFATFQLAPNLQVVSSLVPFKTISTELSSNK